VGAKETFLEQLAEGIMFSGGTDRFDAAKAGALAENVLAKLYEVGPFAYPSLLDEEGLRFVYQWDEDPPLMTVMLWDGFMWRDMIRVPVPDEINNDVNK